jgi:hypothetical protein
MTVLDKAKSLQPMTGTYAAAKFLRKNGVPFFMARYILIVKGR